MVGGLSNTLTGVSHPARINMELRKVADATHRPLEQGVYEDVHGHKWYVKKSDTLYAFMEALAANYFQFLLGPYLSPETGMLSTEDGTYVVSRYNEELTELSENGYLPVFLIDALVASYLIGDCDCLPKNIKTCKGKIFKIDFGAALHSIANENKAILFLSFLNDLNTGFDVKYLHNRAVQTDFVAILQRLSSINPEEFDWLQWQDAAKNVVGLDVAAIKANIMERSHLLQQHLSATTEASTSTSETAPPILVKFYKQLNEEKSTNDFILFNLSPEYLAQLHVQFYRQHHQHPPCFEQRLTTANSKILFSQIIPNMAEKPNTLDVFLVNNIKNIETILPTAFDSQQNTTHQIAETKIPTIDALKRKYSQSSWFSFQKFSIFREGKTSEEVISNLKQRAENNHSGASSQTLQHFGL